MSNYRFTNPPKVKMSKEQKSNSLLPPSIILLDASRTTSVIKVVFVNPFLEKPTGKWYSTKKVLKKSKQLKFPTMGKISYLLEFSKLLFERNEKASQFATIIIRKNGERPTPVMVFAFNDDYVESLDTETNYLLYDPDLGIREITKNELEVMFKNGKFQYFDKREYKIPGIVLEDSENVK